MRQQLRRRLSLVAALAIGFSNNVRADPMEDGQAAYNRRDYTTAQRLWLPLAEQGVARAQNNLGVLYENGKGVRQDFNEALKWYRLAAEQGYAGAWNNLGLIYALGRGIPRDPVLAHMWFNLAASSLTGDLGKGASESRDVVASSMTPEQTVEATEMARNCQKSNYKQCEHVGKPLASLPLPSSRAGASAALDLSSPPAGSTFAVATTSHAVRADDYPTQSVRAHETGEVTVTYVVGDAGFVTSCSVLISSGIVRLDDAACTMVKKRWRYKPATQDGKPVSIQYISKVSFPPR
jgi:TonB family protein